MKSAKTFAGTAMESLKLPQSLFSSHGGKAIVPFPTSSLLPKSTFLIYPNRKLAPSTDFVTTATVAHLSANIFPCRHCVVKQIRSMQFTTRSTSASVQSTADELMEGKSKDRPVSGDSIRRRFIDFYASRGHKVLPSASLVPDDPTVLLTIAGMLQFKPIFLGQVPRQVPRATTAQRCIRTNDVENVGQTSRHHTFFEMLGNFSFGDYFKKEAIQWAWELSTVEFGLPADRLWISVFEDDNEAFEIWHDEMGVPVERIKRMGEDDNFWTSGVTGPCGPCSEIYYDFHPERGYSDTDLNDDTRFIEFYNLVFMEFNKKDDGSLEPLKQKNIDTGLGLERIARILQKVSNNYETDLIYPIIEKTSELAKVPYGLADDHSKLNLKIIGDHLRAIVYLISDGVVPSNIGRGYVVRRLIRRAVRTGRMLGIKGDGQGNLEGAFLPVIAGQHWREEKKYLDQMLVEALLSAKASGMVPRLSGKDAFLLYDTYGFPVEITAEVAQERGVSIDMTGFDIEMENQRRQSQAAHSAVKLAMGNSAELTIDVSDTKFLGYETLSATAIVESLIVNGNPVPQVSEGSEVEVFLNRTPFYAESGGQIGDHGFLYVPQGENQHKAVMEIIDVQNLWGTIREGVLEVGREVEAAVDAKLRQRAKVHHTATHLLQSALKKVIGQETSQAGSLVAFERLRFDFNFHRPLIDDELAEIERLVNKWVGDATPLQTKVMPLADAKGAGAIAMFGEKYGEEVRVVEVPGVSMELCGGTHVSNTSELRGFKIISEQGIASGIRRIEAVAGDAFIEYVNARDYHMKQLCSTLKKNLLEELRITRNEASTLREKAAVYKASIMATKAISVLVESMEDTDADSLKKAAEYLIETLEDPAAVILGSCPGADKAGKFIGPIAKLCGGGGGGRPNFAQAGGRKPENLSNALEKARSEIISVLSEKFK
ncbi:Alanyl-tRNA synthetase, class IIc [Prunus dulcis]|uniref:Alanine--tRNA ligase n=1 Tax=Prunus dulcis TaxID=3755 RepID=A0A4Y1RZH9_PRUDU|nr:Alanyl-tRNA synthetase, class IIc [Prunus dulcis]